MRDHRGGLVSGHRLDRLVVAIGVGQHGRRRRPQPVKCQPRRDLANARSQPTLLDLGKSYPHAVFTAVIYGDHRSKFGTPETSLRGKRICVTGRISEYHGKPEIVLTDPSQLTE